MRVTTESGVEGLSEVCPLGPTRLRDDGHGTPSVITEFAPAYIGPDIENHNLISETTDTAMSDHGVATSDVDIARGDAFAQLGTDAFGRTTIRSSRTKASHGESDAPLKSASRPRDLELGASVRR
jgi:hypothetical protein